jgi:PAS domain S-box-containing protein
MTELLSDIIGRNDGILAVVSLPDFRIVSANQPFRNLAAAMSVNGENPLVEEVLGCTIGTENEKRIMESLQQNGIASAPNLSERYRMLFLRLHGMDERTAVLRVQIPEAESRIDRYARLIENNVAGIFQSTSDGILVDCNRSFAEMLGYPDKSHMIGMRTDALYFSGGDRDTFISALRKNNRVVNFEIDLRRQDGSRIHCLENTYLTCDETGRELISGTIVDITAQKLAEEAILESEKRLEALASVSHEAVIFVDEDVIVDCNDQFAGLFGYHRRADVLNMNIRDFIPPGDVHRLFVAMDVSSSNRTEIRAFNRESEALVLEVSGIYLKYRGNKVRVFVMADVTAKKKSEFALEQTVLRLRNVLENAPNAILITIEGAVHYCNQAALSMLGADEEDEIFGKPVLDFVTDEYRNEVATDFQLVSRGGEVEYKEIRVFRKDQDDVDVGIKSSLTVFENRPAIQISLTDISERMKLMQEQMRVRIIEEINVVLKKEIEEHKITQERLLEQERYTRNLIESSLDMIVACDASMRLTEFNKAAETQFGIKRKDAIGKSFQSLFFREADFEHVRSELGTRGEFFGEVSSLRRNGEIFQSLMSGSVIRDGHGGASGFMGIFRDITEYRSNERKALEQKAKLESIFNSTENMMMWTMDRRYRLTSCNANFLRWTGDALDEPVQLGENVRSILHRHADPDSYQDQLNALDNAFLGRPQQFELAMGSRSTGITWLQVFLNPVYVDDTLEEISCLAYDTTDRKTIEKRIREALKEKEVLLQEIHHRVKNNLQVISSILNLQSSYVQDEKTLEILQESQNRIKSMSFIHETLYRTADFSQINFSEYLSTLANNLIQSYSLQRHRVSFHPDLDDVTMHIDQAIPCGLIVNELVSNALKYAFPGEEEGDLYLVLGRTGNTVRLRVADNGAGLPEDFRYEKTDSLGIQLVYTLTEQIDGAIEVNSAPGKGTEFIITFEVIPPKS